MNDIGRIAMSSNAQTASTVTHLQVWQTKAKMTIHQIDYQNPQMSHDIPD